MSVGTVLLLVLVLLLVGILPVWPHAQNLGWGPLGSVGTVLVVVILLILFGVIR